MQHSAVTRSQLDPPVALLDGRAAVGAETAPLVGLDTQRHDPVQLITTIPPVLDRHGRGRFDAGIEEQLPGIDWTPGGITAPIPGGKIGAERRRVYRWLPGALCPASRNRSLDCARGSPRGWARRRLRDRRDGRLPIGRGRFERRWRRDSFRRNSIPRRRSGRGSCNVAIRAIPQTRGDERDEAKSSQHCGRTPSVTSWKGRRWRDIHVRWTFRRLFRSSSFRSSPFPSSLFRSSPSRNCGFRSLHLERGRTGLNRRQRCRTGLNCRQRYRTLLNRRQRRRRLERYSARGTKIATVLFARRDERMAGLERCHRNRVGAAIAPFGIGRPVDRFVPDRQVVECWRDRDETVRGTVPAERPPRARAPRPRGNRRRSRLFRPRRGRIERRVRPASGFAAIVERTWVRKWFYRCAAVDRIFRAVALARLILCNFGHPSRRATACEPFCVILRCARHDTVFRFLARAFPEDEYSLAARQFEVCQMLRRVARRVWPALAFCSIAGLSAAQPTGITSVTAKSIRIEAVSVPLSPRDPSVTALGELFYAGGLWLTSKQTDRFASSQTSSSQDRTGSQPLATAAFFSTPGFCSTLLNNRSALQTRVWRR